MVGIYALYKKIRYIHKQHHLEQRADHLHILSRLGIEQFKKDIGTRLHDELYSEAYTHGIYRGMYGTVYCDEDGLQFSYNIGIHGNESVTVGLFVNHVDEKYFCDYNIVQKHLQISLEHLKQPHELSSFMTLFYDNMQAELYQGIKEFVLKSNLDQDLAAYLRNHNLV